MKAMRRQSSPMRIGKRSSMLKSALWYAEHGVPVFPCSPRAKEPFTAHGFKDATADAHQIRRWWRRWPDANIGIPTGKASGLLVLNVDPPKRGL